SFWTAVIIRTPYNLKLLRTVLVQKRDWHTHHTSIIARNTRCERHLNSIVVIVTLIRIVVVDDALVKRLVLRLRHEFKYLMATAVLNVSEPLRRHRNNPHIIICNSLVLVLRIIIRHSKPHTIAALIFTATQPQLVVLNQWEDF